MSNKHARTGHLFPRTHHHFSLWLSGARGMPYVDLYSRDDFAQLHYITNTASGSVSDFDPAKATIVLLHPFTFDSTWTDSQMEDPRLGGRYNVVAFDSRFSGKSRTKLSGKLDYWVLAADLAYAFQVRSIHSS